MSTNPAFATTQMTEVAERKPFVTVDMSDFPDPESLPEHQLADLLPRHYVTGSLKDCIRKSIKSVGYPLDWKIKAGIPAIPTPRLIMDVIGIGARCKEFKTFYGENYIFIDELRDRLPARGPNCIEIIFADRTTKLFTWSEFCFEFLGVSARWVRKQRELHDKILEDPEAPEEQPKRKGKKEHQEIVSEVSSETLTPLSQLQSDVAVALAAQGFSNVKADAAVRAATGEDIDTLFSSAMAILRPVVEIPKPAIIAPTPQLSDSKKHGIENPPSLRTRSEATLPPPIAGEPLPEPDAGSLEELRQQIHRMADIHDIHAALGKYLTTLVEPILVGHPFQFTQHCYASLQRVECIRHNYAVYWDWVEDVRALQLGRIVDTDALLRPKISWFRDGEWQKPCSPIGDNNVTFHVLFDWQAAENYPEAFGKWKD